MMSVENNLNEEFRAAVQAQAPLAIAVSNGGRDEPVIRTLERPFAVIGQAGGCDIQLRGKGVGYRHAYLQVIGGRIFCVDLGSKSGIQWDDDTDGSGWLAPGRCARIGGFEVRIAQDLPLDEQESFLPDDCSPLDQMASDVTDLPDVDVEFLATEEEESVSHQVNRVITLVGRGSGCKFKLKSSKVSKVHCCLVLTPSGLWVVDLLGRRGTRVNHKRVRYARLDDGRLLTVGRFQVKVHSSVEPVDTPESDVDPTAETVDEDAIESQRLEDTAVLDPNLDDDSSEGSGPLLSRPELNKVFKVEQEGSTIVVTPMEGAGFRYHDVHKESNQILQLLAAADHPRLVIDLGLLNYSGSELIGALIRVARYATDHGEGASFCNASVKMRKVLKNMSLSKLWPYHETLDQAMAAVGPSKSAE